MIFNVLLFLGGIGLQELILIGLYILMMGIPVAIILSITLSRKKNETVSQFRIGELAPFWKRLFARLIDGAIVYVVTFIIAFILYQSSNSESALSSSGVWGLIIFCWIYQPFMESSGGTFGKKVLGLRTIDLTTGVPPKIGKSFLRSMLYFFFTLLMIIPAILSGLAVLWSDKNQTWHDMATNIVVINNPQSAKKSYSNGAGQGSILKHADKLKELKSLQDQGIISNEEFESEKRKILDS